MPRIGLDSITVYITPELKQRLAEWACQEKRSISFLVNQLIEAEIESRDEAERRFPEQMLSAYSLQFKEGEDIPF